MSGLFSEWQPRYAERGVATFPVKGKVPAVRNYLRIGRPASAQFALRFPDANAFGFGCGERSRITVLDVDSADEKVLADALARHGPTPVIVRSGSGNHQAYYRHNGEGRRIRPDPSLPIDVLGGGFVVAPPSIGSKGAYSFIQGGLDDIERLPVMKGLDAAPLKPVPAPPPIVAPGEKIATGKRNEAVWRYAMKISPLCDGDINRLLEAVMQFNQTNTYDPLPDQEVLKIVAQAMMYQRDGRNWIGNNTGSGVVAITRDEINSLAATEPDAFALLSILRSNHGSREFILANSFAASLRWTLRRFTAARNTLTKRGVIECVRPGGRGPHDPAIFRLAI